MATKATGATVEELPAGVDGFGIDSSRQWPGGRQSGRSAGDGRCDEPCGRGGHSDGKTKGHGGCQDEAGE